jgi:superfamily II DNA or RNA helicase
VPYEYFVHAAELGGEELDEFLELSRQIAKKIAAMGGDDADLDDENLTAMFVRRRSIVENASDKLRVFDDIVRSLSDRSLALVYTSSKNPAQLEQAMRCLAGLGIAAAKITEEESGQPGEFKAILEAFVNGAIDMLVAKRVLDEGVDLPPVRQAIMLASSSVEREWIQRRGRILRMFPGKQTSVIHDILSLPPVSAIDYDQAVLKFISSELERVRAFAQHAMNPVEASRMIDEIHTNYFLR